MQPGYYQQNAVSGHLLGRYDARADLATPCHQTELDLTRLDDSSSIVLKYYASGHMTYLDDTARRLQQTDLINFLNSVTVSH